VPRPRYVLPLALVSALLAVPAAFGAAQPAGYVTLANNATLVDTLDVAVTISYVCPPGVGTVGEGDVEVEQGASFGDSGVFMTICDDQKHSTTVLVTGGPFTPGSAVAAGAVANDNANEFDSPIVEITIRG
jgi:hypothetical protein